MVVAEATPQGVRATRIVLRVCLSLICASSAYAGEEHKSLGKVSIAASCKTMEQSVGVGKMLYTLLRTDDAEQLRKSISRIQAAVVDLGCTPADDIAMRVWSAPDSMQNFYAAIIFSDALVFRIRAVLLPFQHAVAIEVDVGQLFKYLDEMQKRKGWKDACHSKGAHGALSISTEEAERHKKHIVHPCLE